MFLPLNQSRVLESYLSFPEGPGEAWLPNAFQCMSMSKIITVRNTRELVHRKSFNGNAERQAQIYMLLCGSELQLFLFWKDVCPQWESEPPTPPPCTRPAATSLFEQTAAITIASTIITAAAATAAPTGRCDAPKTRRRASRQYRDAYMKVENGLGRRKKRLFCGNRCMQASVNTVILKRRQLPSASRTLMCTISTTVIGSRLALQHYYTCWISDVSGAAIDRFIGCGDNHIVGSPCKTAATNQLSDKTRRADSATELQWSWIFNIYSKPPGFCHSFNKLPIFETLSLARSTINLQ